MPRYRHYWTCDTCGKFVHQGAVRCVTCTFDVRAEEERRQRTNERLDAMIRRLNQEDERLRAERQDR